MLDGDVCSPQCVGCAVRTSFAALGLDAGVGWDATDLESGGYSTFGVRSRGELLELLAAAAADPRPIIPLPLPPRPAPTVSRSRRCRGRVQRATALWEAGTAIITGLNLMWSGTRRRADAETKEQFTPLREVTGRLRECAPSLEVAEAWVDVFDAAKRIRAARRMSAKSGSTGGALLASLRSSLGECYEKVNGGAGTPLPTV